MLANGQERQVAYRHFKGMGILGFRIPGKAWDDRMMQNIYIKGSHGHFPKKEDSDGHVPYLRLSGKDRSGGPVERAFGDQSGA